MPERPTHHNDHNFQAAIEAMIGVGEEYGYRQVVHLLARDLLDAALPRLRKMIEAEEGRHVE